MHAVPHQHKMSEIYGGAVDLICFTLQDPHSQWKHTLADYGPEYLTSRKQIVGELSNCYFRGGRSESPAKNAAHSTKTSGDGRRTSGVLIRGPSALFPGALFNARLSRIRSGWTGRSRRVNRGGRGGSVGVNNFSECLPISRRHAAFDPSIERGLILLSLQPLTGGSLIKEFFFFWRRFDKELVREFRIYLRFSFGCSSA